MSVNQKNHLAYWISFGLLLSFIVSLIGSFFPYEGKVQTILFKLDGLFAVTAFACFAAKASSEKADLPAAGFTILAISEGLFLSTIEESANPGDEILITAVLFMIPSFLLISYYKLFPRWLHIAGILSTVPFVTLVIIYYSNGFLPGPILKYTVYLTYQLILLCWAWHVWKDRNK